MIMKRVKIMTQKDRKQAWMTKHQSSKVQLLLKPGLEGEKLV